MCPGDLRKEVSHAPCCIGMEETPKVLVDLTWEDNSFLTSALQISFTDRLHQIQFSLSRRMYEVLLS